MNCSVPGCPHDPHAVPVPVRATKALEWEPEHRMTAITNLCDTHRAEFQALGWLALDDDEEEEPT